ncbi:MAG: aa3-type cytochrome c oxidase subunit IV [Acetobacteraceae bacterium]|nr:aa3-type cytochrome c oxidase subunit IV [Acetobacteraceae bacterium]MCX7684599.1 aa3-type cytochrome c oxidase subunit IV [Acetobacteraceae bacterium]MDW8398695.1 preprotein translocase subunit SecE [Acetobacteraceae bacterium]
MAEEEQQVEFIPVKDTDILPERTEMWERFGQFTTYAIVATAAVLVLLAIFLA